jgi:hypothetical protein
MEWVGHVACMEYRMDAHKILDRKLVRKGRDHLGDLDAGRVDNIRIVVKEIVCEGLDWIYPSQYKIQ